MNIFCVPLVLGTITSLPIVVWAGDIPDLQMVMMSGESRGKVVAVKRLTIESVNGPMQMVLFHKNIIKGSQDTASDIVADLLKPQENVVDVSQENQGKVVAHKDKGLVELGAQKFNFNTLNGVTKTAQIEIHELTFRTGLRHDKVKWSKAHPSGTPNILSEIEWRDMDSAFVQAEYQYTSPTGWHLRAETEIAYTADGEMQDSDYNSDNRKDEFSRSLNDASGSSMFDLSLGLGYVFSFLTSTGSISVTPLVGYAYNQQNLRAKNGNQVIPDYGKFSGLDSGYDTIWHGPWLGFALDWKLTDKHKLYGGFEYHWTDYEGEGEWNLRDDLAQPVSFRHTADGDGYQFEAGYSYGISENIDFDVNFAYYKYETGSGKDHMFGSSGSSAKMKFNGAQWESYSVGIGLRYLF